MSDKDKIKTILKPIELYMEKYKDTRNMEMDYYEAVKKFDTMEKAINETWELGKEIINE